MRPCPNTRPPAFSLQAFRFSALFPLLLALLALPAAPQLRALDWLPLTDAERTATASTIDPDAGAEILTRIEQIDASKSTGTIEGYIRLKIYNDKGVRLLDVISIPYDPKSQHIKSLAARVIKPDGTITNVEQKDFYDREIAKFGDKRMRQRSFAFPSLAPGMIVEYKWQCVLKDSIDSLPLLFMSDMPARRVLFRIKPRRDYGENIVTKAYFHLCDELPVTRDKDGYSSVEMLNVKAAAEEPLMPPAVNVQPWIFFYTTHRNSRMDLFYQPNSSLYKAEQAFKGTKLVRETAAAIAQNIDTPAARAAAINDYCRGQIRNVDYYKAPGVDDTKRKGEWPRSPDEIIKAGVGDSFEIQRLFITLARALGMDAQPAFCANKSNGPFLKNLPVSGQLPDPLVAMRMDDWQFFDPARREVDTGMLCYDNEGQTVLLMPNATSSAYGKWQTTPKAPAEKSLTKRTANLRLDAEGTLEGDVKLEYTGHAAYDARDRFYAETTAGLEERARKFVLPQFPNADVTNINISTPKDFLKPFVLSYSVRVPGYADRTGRRLFVQPGFFTKNQSPPFTAPARVNAIYLDYPISTEDDVTIKLPPGCRVEEGSAPVTTGQTSWGRYDITISQSPRKGEIYYKRVFKFLPLQMSASQYPRIKSIFDLVTLQDSHTLSLQFDSP